MEQRESGGSTLVPFPVCLAIKYGDTVTEECPDFVLNIQESWVFVKTESPLPEGTSLLMHVYIPPESKLLAEMTGRVLRVDHGHSGDPGGMHIRLTHLSAKEREDLENYLEGSKHLVDRNA